MNRRNTIEQMVQDAERLQQANKFLNERFAQTETQFVDEWKAIEALDIASGTGEPGELEKRLNDEFTRSLDALRNATAR
ncbi:hypothetical protein [Sinorhizobium psoraleae]|uniref:Uncharacterized protein n=1 Tax=Sinorhizobium psoraleae TaxID=520838 RepID=A0ABT4KB03_9HYPH|nr:hypothetical protein [Sinorhizobium psoraleae]MCZ4089096.1 hypothetical protein [Sinorhizobium psoraleae]